MSAKAYRDKKALPLVEKLKEVVKNLTIIGSFQRYVSGISLPSPPVPKPLTVLQSVAPVPCRNDAPNAPNQTLFLESDRLGMFIGADKREQ